MKKENCYIINCYHSYYHDLYYIIKSIDLYEPVVFSSVQWTGIDFSRTC